ncbi:PhzF family phenazine biosynthesis protein [Enterococcus sp. 669A]|uniref:PhzF family phenazine biosynthesis protein n=1 Tax=Candidatus Enterococcus moelleringii TaxID=2815325 RepID=A0ABS3LG24_9ENTE|nr:PhzF family phenazine biosynthesis protein [Enterococcus sp. 669A]MBO1308592.1 PhzF family phenazine biosynthesis protein [Enterococcus sp. 669A]
MMKQYVVDAFTNVIFKGNPAAVCILDAWLEDDLLQAIAKENNLSETAFAVSTGENQYHLRWFTPTDEIDLCGHATLATAFVLFNYYQAGAETITFDTLSGKLIVAKSGDRYQLDLPSYDLKEVAVTDEMANVLGVRPLEAYMGRDLVCVLPEEKFVTEYVPNSGKLATLDGMLVHITAKGTEYDCISRSFAPKIGILEDPVCGSGHCHLVPLWSKKLSKTHLTAFQASERSGVLYCDYLGERTRISGEAALYSIAELQIGN